MENQNQTVDSSIKKLEVKKLSIKQVALVRGGRSRNSRWS